MKQHATNIPHLNTLQACLNRMLQDGYTEDFKATPDGLRSELSHKIYNPEEVNIVNAYRFEGMSHPGDMAVMYVVETTDGRKGTLVDTGGANTDAALAALLARTAHRQGQ